ncbi:MAG: dUTP diphosphatase [Porphyromonas sp.]|nr:dUTP diphosphatase [Porphyromonas sp.]
MKIKIVNRSHHPLPSYATTLSAGMDLRAFLSKPIVLAPMQRKLIPTGLSIELPPGYEAQIRPRSGLALNHGISLVNTPGTIDADYRGEIGLILINLSDCDFVINDGDRVAQMVISTYHKVAWEPCLELSESERASGGFGHSGNS